MHTHKTKNKKTNKTKQKQTNKKCIKQRSFNRERNSGEVIITYKTLPKILEHSFQLLPIVLTYTCPSRYKNSLIKSINKSIKIKRVQKSRFLYKGTNSPSINNLSGSGLLKKAIFPSSLAFFKMWPLLFSSFAYFFRKIRVDLNIYIIRQLALKTSSRSGKLKKRTITGLVSRPSSSFLFCELAGIQYLLHFLSPIHR